MHEHHLDVAANTQPLRVTLVWSDAPADASSAAPVVNNLDLEVVDPSGATTFLGNDFANGVSTTGGAADSLNNVEMVLVNNPAAGDWIDSCPRHRGERRQPGRATPSSPPATLAAAPVNTGVQDTLVVRVRFADIAARAVAPEPPGHDGQTSRATSIASATDRRRWCRRIAASSISTIPKSYYDHPSRHPLIELTEEVVAKLVAAEPTVLDLVERMIIVTNDVNFTEATGRRPDPGPTTCPADSRGRSRSRSSRTRTRRRGSRTACCTSSAPSISTPMKA